MKTWITYREEPPQVQVFTMKSLTQPNEVMSIREMIIRHAKGLPIDSPHGEGVFLGDDLDIPDIHRLDLTEIADLRDKWAGIADRISKQQRPKGKMSAEGDKPQPSDGQPTPTPPTSPTPPTPTPPTE